MSEGTIGMLAVFIDAENFHLRRALGLFQIISVLGLLETGYLYGNEIILPQWQRYSTRYLLQQRCHQGGREAADLLLKKDVRSVCSQGHCRIILAADDGGYASLVKEMKSRGNVVYGVGSAHASKKLRIACTDFFTASEHANDIEKSDEIQEETCTTSEELSLPVRLNPDPPRLSEERASFTSCERLFGLFLHQTFHALNLSKGRCNLVQEPQEYLLILETLVRDPLFTDILNGERKSQWQLVVALAKRCDEAYKQGQQSVENTFCGLLVNLQNPRFTEQVQRDKQMRQDSQPGWSQKYVSTYEQYLDQEVLQQWYQRGYQDRGKVLQVETQAIWRRL